MSHYETADQRTIRLLRQKIARQERERQKEERDSKLREKQRQLSEEKQRLENERLQHRLERVERNRMEVSQQAILQLQQQVEERERISASRIEQLSRNQQATIRTMQEQNARERKNLEAEISSTRQELNQSLARARRETDARIQETVRINEEKINRLKEESQSEIRAIDVKISRLAASMEQANSSQRELAQFWLTEADRYDRHLRDLYHEQLFDRKELERLRRNIQSTREDIANSSYQSAITTGRQSVYDAMDLKEEMAERELEWNTLYNDIQNRKRELLEQLEHAEHRIYEFKIDGRKHKDEHGIDYWTNGHYSTVKQEIDQFLEGIQEDSLQQATLEELRALQERIHDYQQEVILTENASETNLAMAISRPETARMIGETLNEHFAQSEQYGSYFARELNQEYHAYFQNPVTGDASLVIITPEEDPATHIVNNHIEFYVRNSSQDQIAANEKARRVAERLQQEGITDCHFPCMNQYGEQTNEMIRRLGSIQDVREGKQESRIRN